MQHDQSIKLSDVVQITGDRREDGIVPISGYDTAEISDGPTHLGFHRKDGRQIDIDQNGKAYAISVKKKIQS